MNIITGKKFDAQGIRKDNGFFWHGSDNISRWSQNLDLIPEPKEYSMKYILDYPSEFGLVNKTKVVKFAKWFNENQWRGSQGDKTKRAFVNCDYVKIAFLGLKEISEI